MKLSHITNSIFKGIKLVQFPQMPIFGAITQVESEYFVEVLELNPSLSKLKVFWI